MQGIQKSMPGGISASVSRRASGRVGPAAAALACAALAAGCGTAIETPLPDFKPVAATSLTQAERAKAVEELNKKRATHEQDAEEQIEQAR